MNLYRRPDINSSLWLFGIYKMSMKKFDFWQDHSIHYLEMAFKTDKQSRLENPDGYGKRTGECGDTVEMFISIQFGSIEFISYIADGCMNTHACANTVISFAEKKSLNNAWDITPEMVIEYLETLPEEEYHCAELAVSAFYKALADCQEKGKAEIPPGSPIH
jgi:nitrogen fixation NifU-like protein